MSKRRIEGYLPKALQVLEAEFGSVIPSAYNGYISAFGASIVQSGLKPTLALFENKSDNTKEDKSSLPKVILQVLDHKAEEDSLLRYVLKHDRPGLKEEIVDIAIAVKLALRTFELKKG